MSGFGVDLIRDAGEFRAAAFDFLGQDPLRHSVILTHVQSGAQRAAEPGEPSWFALVRTGGAVVGAAMRTPGRSVFLGVLPLAAVDDVVEAFHAVVPQAGGVDGATDLATAFADGWCARTGANRTVLRRTRLFRLGVLRPASAPGESRLMTGADVALIDAWNRDFAREVGEPEPAGSNWTAITGGRMWLWERDGEPVGMAGYRPPVFGVSRVGPVYTPPEHRGRGYASAVTSRASADIVESGAQACLYTDLANATTNRIYQDIGYRRIGDHVVYAFLPC